MHTDSNTEIVWILTAIFDFVFFSESDLDNPERTGGVFGSGREALFPPKLGTKFSGCSTKTQFGHHKY